MTYKQPIRIKSIGEYHRFMGLAKPEHPLVSVLNFDDIRHLPGTKSMSLIFDFYSIALKRNFNGKMKYGQQAFDFDEGIMTFMAPGQVFGITVEAGEALRHSGWMLLLHPDFLWNTPAAKGIQQYEYFDYAVFEALFLSDEEEQIIVALMQSIAQEYHSNIDAFSQRIIIAQIELMLSYCDRFYQRQFITRKITNHGVLARLDDFLTDYFAGDLVAKHGLPTVQSIATALMVSPSYLSNLLKSVTGQSTQQHIHDKLIAKAKEKLTTTDLSVSEIAYELGFEHPQSFSKLFKTKTNLSALEFRQSFNMA